MTATTANTQQYGTWRRGFLPDKEIISILISDINSLENDDRWYIKTLTIRRTPDLPNDYDIMAQLGFTSIKATISKDPYV